MSGCHSVEAAWELTHLQGNLQQTARNTRCCGRNRLNDSNVQREECEAGIGISQRALSGKRSPAQHLHHAEGTDSASRKHVSPVVVTLSAIANDEQNRSRNDGNEGSANNSPLGSRKESREELGQHPADKSCDTC
jgi:hypothetical protein